MGFEKELDFFKLLLDKMRIKCETVRNFDFAHDPDFGLRRVLGIPEDYKIFFADNFSSAKDNTLYMHSDPFGCCYAFMRLPKCVEDTILLIGPYMMFEPTSENILQASRRFNMPSSRLNMLQKCFSHIPCIENDAIILGLVNGFAETVWGRSDAYEIVDLTPRSSPIYTSLANSSEAEDGSVTVRMDLMERRYGFENQLIENISQGREHRVELMLSSFSGLVFEKRSHDPLRNMKNYCIICNTLMRKAAEWGGVHPFYIDNLSSDFAKRIESVSTTDKASVLILEMGRAYCRLVKSHNDTSHSPPVQKAVIYIDDHLSSPLALRLVAEQLNLTPSYLSALFKKEIGKPITDFITEKRMKLAAGLLISTPLQVQAVAQQCGILDVNYFSKLFKKYHSLTPKQYRSQNKSRKSVLAE